MITGAIASVDNADISHHCGPRWKCCDAISIGTVLASLNVRIREKRNSFQAKMKHSKKVAVKLGSVMGMIILKNIWVREAPSTMAASSMEWGTCDKKLRITHTAMGKLNEV
jgi:hypothetical protein